MIYLESTVAFDDRCNIYIFISTDFKYNSLIVAVMPYMVSWTLVTFGSGNSLLPDGTKPLSGPMLTYHH